MKLKHFLGTIVIAVLSATATFYFLNEKMNKGEQSTQVLPQNPTPAQYKTVSYSSGAVPHFVDAAAKATPAVVHVKTSFEIKTKTSRQFYGDEMFEWFFGRRGKQMPQGKHALGAGSGVLVSADGYIVTNHHVIDRADIIEITLSNNKTYTAKLIGTDPDTDLAVLKIEENNLPYLNFANSDNIRVGEWVLAVGNPFNLSSTVTAGIVSAKGRNINLLENYGTQGNTAIESFIQTDAAVNPGNSGGALVSTRGELIGINTAIATPTGAFAGYSFAVPANLVAKIVKDIQKYGTAQRAFLGVNISNITTEMAHQLKLKDMNGVYVANVLEDGAAFDAGILKDDVIVAIDNEKVNSTAQLQEKIAEYHPDDLIEVEFFRAGKRKKMEILLK